MYAPWLCNVFNLYNNYNKQNKCADNFAEYINTPHPFYHVIGTLNFPALYLLYLIYIMYNDPK